MGEKEWLEHDKFQTGSRQRELREELAAFQSFPTKVLSERAKSDSYHPERDMYFDMDIALPFHWESLTGKGHKLSKSSDSQEFEFNMALPPADSANEEDISPADDLFYKGQLLPLHLPRRLQMVQKLSSPKQAEKNGSSSPSSVSVSCFFQPNSLKYTSLGQDESYLGSALVNSRSSSFHSQGSSFWDSHGEGDSGDSSSSRDSSGSSQDACVSEKHPQTSGKDSIDNISQERRNKQEAFLQHREFFSNHNMHPEKSIFSSWLRTPFKWKVLFGLKKASKTKIDLKVEGPLHAKQSLKDFAEKSPNSVSMNVSSSRTSSYKSAELKSGVKESMHDYQHQPGLFSFPPAEKGTVVREKDKERQPSKTRESINKYLNILKPLNVKVPQKTDHSDLSLRMVDIRSASFPTNASPPKSAFSGHLTSPTKPVFVEKRSPPLHSLSGNLRVPSFSRSSRASTNVSNAVARIPSPNHSGVLTHSSSSTMSELQSAIQGAIAHCKQSQAGK